jgi:endonuclease/exonuclease/phosphatase (EEP) superfamily protein YafD
VNWRLLRKPLVLGGWSVLVALLLIALLRLTHLDDWVGGAVLSAIAPIAFLAAYPVFVGAAWRRRRAATVVAAICVILQLWWFHAMLPVIHQGRSLPVGAARLRVMTANLLYTNGRAGGLGPIIRNEHPDVLALEEFSNRTAPEVAQSGALSAFGYRVTHVENSPSGIALFSRLPLRDPQVLTIAGRQVIRAVVVTPAGPVAIYVVHTVAPISKFSEQSWSAELSEVTKLVEANRGPLLVVGDFNATDGNRPFADLLHRGHLRDVLDATGRGYATTWPQNRRLLPALVRPDHVLAGRGIVPLGGRTVDNPGSDHRALVVDLGVRRP